MKQYFFVTSFGSLYNKVLPLMDKKKDEGEIIIVTANKNIYYFFKEYISCKRVFLDMNPNIFSRKKWYLFITEILKMRWYYDICFKGVQCSEIYFFGSGWTIGIFNIIQRLSKNNIIYQYPSNQSLGDSKCVTSWKAKIIKLFAKLITNVDVDVVTEMGMTSFNLNEKFYRKNAVHIVNDELDKTPLNSLMQLFTYDENILIATEDVVKYNRVEKSEYILKMSTLVQILNKMKKKYMVKPHPNEPETYDVFPSMSIISFFIPSELLMESKWKYVIGLESLTLIKATQLTDAKVISLIDFVEYKDSSVSQSFKEWQQKESSKILFPKNEKELEEMLS
jgi:hypothetical protein